MKPYPPLDLSRVVTRFAYAPEKSFGCLIAQMGPMADGTESIFMYYLDAETEFGDDCIKHILPDQICVTSRPSRLV